MAPVTRSVGMKAYGGEDKMTSMNKVAVSGLAGSTAGAVAGLARMCIVPFSCFPWHALVHVTNNWCAGGPARLLPAVVIWGLVGAGGQAIANRSPSSHPSQSNEGTSWISMLNPLKKLTDEEYIDMMKEKILKVEVDIALIDDRIAELRAAEEAKGRDSSHGNAPR